MSDRREPGDQLPPQFDANQERTPEVAHAPVAPGSTRPADTTAVANSQPTTQTGSTGGGTSAGNNANAGTEGVEAKYGYHIIIAGLALVSVLYISTIIIFAFLTPDNLANNVVACMGAITGVIGSLVAAYFGLQSGAAGKEASDAKAEQQSALASAAMGQLDPNQSETAIQNAQQILETGQSN
jgi:hypothetical protein